MMTQYHQVPKAGVPNAGVPKAGVPKAGVLVASVSGVSVSKGNLETPKHTHISTITHFERRCLNCQRAFHESIIPLQNFALWYLLTD